MRRSWYRLPGGWIDETADEAAVDHAASGRIEERGCEGVGIDFLAGGAIGKKHGAANRIDVSHDAVVEETDDDTGMERGGQEKQGEQIASAGKRAHKKTGLEALKQIGGGISRILMRRRK